MFGAIRSCSFSDSRGQTGWGGLDPGWGKQRQVAVENPPYISFASGHQTGQFEKLSGRFECSMRSWAEAGVAEISANPSPPQRPRAGGKL